MGKQHFKAGGFYQNGLKIGEWVEIVRDRPGEYHYIVKEYDEYGEL